MLAIRVADVEESVALLVVARESVDGIDPTESSCMGRGLIQHEMSKNSYHLWIGNAADLSDRHL